MSRILIPLYGLLAALVGLGGLVYFMLFVGGWEFMPVDINAEPVGEPRPALHLILLNLVIVLFFGLQHSVMARPWFKRCLALFLPPAAERSTYVLCSGLVLIALCHLWAPVGGTVWEVSAMPWVILLTSLHLLGWLIALAATLEIDSLHLTGLRQVWDYRQGRESAEPPFCERFLYRVVRHPIQLGVLLGLWAAPEMSATRLILAGSLTIYIFIGLWFEERSLVRSLGQTYLDYRTRVPMIIPFLKLRAGRDNRKSK